MADYAFRTLDDRKEIQKLYEFGASVDEMANYFGVDRSTMFREMTRGYRDDERLPDRRRKYDAEQAQECMLRSFEKRGHRKKRTIAQGSD